MSNFIYDADRAIAAASQSAVLQQNSVLQAVNHAFNWWGGPGIIYVAAVLWLGGRAIGRGRIALLGLRCAEAIAVTSAVGSILKTVLGRERPRAAPDAPWHWNFLHTLTDQAYFSMPSGHTATTATFAAALILVTTTWNRSTRYVLSALSIAALVLVGAARIYSNQHWFSDVGVGALMGAVIGFYLTRWHEQHPRTAFDRAMLGTPETHPA